MSSDRYQILAVDFDGTLADAGVVDAAVLDGLRRVKASGRRLILVTGRQLDDLLRTFPDIETFDRVVAENGAVRYCPASGETVAAAGPPRADFITRLRRERVTPLSVGRVIVATLAPHHARVIDAIRELELDLEVILNKEAVMALPRGVNKASGILQTLGELQTSPRNVIGIGDAENDVDLLDVCGCGVAVANAVPALIQRADIVTRSPAGRGVLEVLESLRLL